MSTSASDIGALENLALGIHLCGLFQDPNQQTAAVARYLCGNIRQQRKVVYIDLLERHQFFRKEIHAAGLNVADLELSGQLVFFTPEETYVKNGRLVPETMVKLLENTIKSSEKQGWQGLAVCGDMTEVIRVGAAPEDLAKYESILNDFFPSSQCVGFCVYDMRLTDPALLMTALRTHPWVYFNHILYDNFCNYDVQHYPPFITTTDHLNHLLRSLHRCHLRTQIQGERTPFFADVLSKDIVYVYQLYPVRRFEYVSPSVREIIGYTPEEHYNDPDLGFKVIHPDDREKLLRFVNDPTEDPLLLRWITKDGRVVWIMQHNVPQHDHTGRVVVIHGVARDVTREHELQQELIKREAETRSLLAQFNAVLQAVPDNLTLQSGDLRVLWANEGAARGLGKEVRDLIGQHCYRLWHDRDTPCDRCPVKRSFETGKPESEIVRTPEGRLWELRAVPIVEDGRVQSVIEMGRDITRHRQLEEQQAQRNKMESLGMLAGGVAHDFNNMLSVILGFGESLLTKLQPLDPLRMEVREILNAAQRSAEMTRQLLAFGRRQIFQTRIVCPNTLLGRMDKVLRRLIGEDIELKTFYAADAGNVEIDPVQFDQIILNLAANARDAMPQGGSLIIETKNADLDDAYASTHLEVSPGAYVMLAVTDTGYGMEESVRQRIFEPFFSTKEKGRASGLGLATVYGIVRQSKGHIFVYSEPGKGTTFKIYLPRVFAESTYVPPEPASVSRQKHTGHILLIEDEPALRKLFEQILKTIGYTVTVAADGDEAIGLVIEQNLNPALVLTDVVLPGMTGAEVVRRLRDKIPGLKALYMSGYTDNAVVHHGVVDSETPFIQKPFTTRELSDKIEEVLNQG